MSNENKRPQSAESGEPVRIDPGPVTGDPPYELPGSTALALLARAFLRGIDANTNEGVSTTVRQRVAQEIRGTAAALSNLADSLEPLAE